MLSKTVYSMNIKIKETKTIATVTLLVKNETKIERKL